MSRKPGVIAKLPDDRMVIVYRDQPLLEKKGKVILSLIDENYSLILGEDNKPKIIIQDVHVYNESMQAATLIGYVD
jgi:hypothetical protein